MRLQLGGHAVEAASQRTDLVTAALRVHARVQIALPHAAGGFGQFPDGGDDARRQQDREPDGGGHHQQRNDQQDQVEAPLQRARAIRERLVIRQRGLGAGHLLQHARLHLAAGVDEQRLLRVQADDSLDLVPGRSDNQCLAGADTIQVDRSGSNRKWRGIKTF